MTEIWLIATDITEEQAAALGELIDPDERARAARTPDGPGRRRYLAAHAAARLLTAAAAGVPPELVRWRRGPHGRPEPVGLEGELSVNLSTAGRWALFAVQQRADGDGEIGVDLEPVPVGRAAARLARRYYPASETDGGAAEFTRRWTRKEAYTKAHGGRLADGLRTHAGPVGGPGPYRIDGPLGPCTVHDLPAPPGHRAAAARTGSRPVRPRLLSYPADLAEEFGVHRVGGFDLHHLHGVDGSGAHHLHRVDGSGAHHLHGVDGSGAHHLHRVDGSGARRTPATRRPDLEGRP